MLLVVVGNSFPAPRRVPGGAPQNTPANKAAREIAVDDAFTKAGRLRYVENNDLCGGSPLQKLFSICMLTAREEPPTTYTQLRNVDSNSTDHVWSFLA